MLPTVILLVGMQLRPGKQNAIFFKEPLKRNKKKKKTTLNQPKLQETELQGVEIWELVQILTSDATVLNYHV